MSHWLDHALVGLLLLLSASYAAMSLGPRALRMRILALLSHVAAGAPQILRLSRAAQKLGAASAAKPKAACAGCDECGAGAADTAQTTPSEIKISVGKIGRRA